MVATNLTGATQFSGSSGTTGQVLTSAGTGAAPNWADAPGGNFQEFATSGTWTKPAGAKFVMVEAWGAGGGGGGGMCSNGVFSGSGGGGGGSYASQTFIASTLPATVTVTVGAGGVGAPSVSTELPGGSGSTGGSSTFGTSATSTLVTGYGGGGGSGGSSGTNGESGGGGGVFGFGDQNANGGLPQLLNSVSPFGRLATQAFGGANRITGAGVGASGYGGGAGSGGGVSSAGGDSYFGGGGGGATTGGGIASQGGRNSRSFNNPSNGGTNISPSGQSGIFGNGGGAGRFSQMPSGTPITSIANVGNVYIGITSNVGYYRAPFNPTNSWEVRPLPSGITSALERFNLTSSSTDFVIARGISCFSSTDGITWTQRTNLPFSLSETTSVIKFVNGVYFASNGASLATSTDLITWTDRTAQINASGATLRDVAWNGTVYVIVADNNRTYTSSNLSTWTLVTLLSAGTIFTVAASTTGRIVAICSTSPFVRYSDDNGATWTSATSAITGASNASNTLIFAAGRFVFGTVSATVYFSTNGISWTTGTASGNGYQGRMLYDSGASLFYCATNSGVRTTRSSDGSSWFDTAAISLTLNRPGGAGGNGGIAGGGGAGGQSVVGFASGAGGNGGNGLVRVYF
jgi:hypothetical protein